MLLDCWMLSMCYWICHWFPQSWEFHDSSRSPPPHPRWSSFPLGFSPPIPVQVLWLLRNKPIFKHFPNGELNYLSPSNIFKLSNWHKLIKFANGPSWRSWYVVVEVQDGTLQAGDASDGYGILEEWPIPRKRGTAGFGFATLVSDNQICSSMILNHTSVPPGKYFCQETKICMAAL